MRRAHTISLCLFLASVPWSTTLQAQSPSLYNACVEKLVADAMDKFCGGLLTGYEIGYRAGRFEGFGSGSITNATGSGFAVGSGTAGITIDDGRAIVLQLPTVDGAPPQEPIVLGIQSSPNDFTLGSGPYAFDVKQLEATPLSEWLEKNQASVDLERLGAMRDALQEIGADKPALFEIPSVAE